MFKFLMFWPVISPVRSFEKGREVSFASLFSVGIVIFIFQESIICPEKTFNLIGIKKFLFELFVRGPV